MRNGRGARRAAPGPVPRGPAGMKALNIALIVLTVAVASGAALLARCAWSSANGGVIFPNVSACGINFGGMTVEEAAERLAESDFAAYNGKSVAVDFPSGFRLEVKAADVGLEADCVKAARELYAFGRYEDPVRRTLAYLRCLFKRHELFSLPRFHLDEAALRALIARAAACVNVEARRSSYVVEEDRVKYTRGKTGLRADEAALFGLITGAFRSRSYVPLKYEPQTTYPDELSADELFALVHKEPADAAFDASFNVMPESRGVTFDLEAARAALEGADYGQTVEIPLKTLEPKVCSGDLEALLYRDRLASVTTQLTDNEVRSRNIQLAAAQIDGYILLPGRVFSYNEAVGERTEAKGYGAATAYSYGELVQQVGGGICQLSSTLYYCCLLANLDIVFRTGHIYYQTYVPYGMDATVSWGGPDFRFKNSTDYPIKICAWRTGKTVTAELWGTKTDGTYVQMSYEINERYPCGATYTEDASVPKGSRKVADPGRDGMKVTTYRSVYGADGTLLSRRLEAVTNYSARNADIRVAPGEKPE